MTRNQLATCIRLNNEGYKPVDIPYGDDPPIPGLILFFRDGKESELVMVKPDGGTVDLLGFYRGVMGAEA